MAVQGSSMDSENDGCEGFMRSSYHSVPLAKNTDVEECILASEEIKHPFEAHENDWWLH